MNDRFETTLRLALCLGMTLIASGCESGPGNGDAFRDFYGTGGMGGMGMGTMGGSTGAETGMESTGMAPDIGGAEESSGSTGCEDDMDELAGMCGYIGDYPYEAPDTDTDDQYMICGDFAQEACDCLHGGLAIGNVYTLRILCSDGRHHAMNIIPCEPQCYTTNDLCPMEPQRLGQGEDPFVGSCRGTDVGSVASCRAAEYCGGAGNVVEHEVYGDQEGESPCVDFYPDADNGVCSYG